MSEVALVEAPPRQTQSSPPPRVPTKRPRPLSVPEHRLKPEGGAPPERRASRPAAVAMSGARRRALAGLRIVFGFAWGVDAWLKWQPAFVRGLTGYLTDARSGQPQLVKDWIGAWIKVVNLNPHLFAYALALGETAVAIGLVLGVFSRTTYLTGAVLAATIWSTAEAFGGPYKAGSSDIGAAIMYVFVFAALWIGCASQTWSLGRSRVASLRT